MEQISSVVKTNVHREILSKALKGDRLLPKYAFFRLGTGGLDENGKPIKHNGRITALLEPIRDVGNGNVEKNYDISETLEGKLYEYIYKLKVDTTAKVENGIEKDIDLIGKNITELGLYDVEGNLCYLETFKGYGPLQAEHTYEFEMRILVN